MTPEGGDQIDIGTPLRHTHTDANYIMCKSFVLMK